MVRALAALRRQPETSSSSSTFFHRLVSDLEHFASSRVADLNLEDKFLPTINFQVGSCGDMVNEIGRLRIHLKSEERLLASSVKTFVTIGLQPISVQNILCQELRLNRPYLASAFSNLVLSYHCSPRLNINITKPFARYVTHFLSLLRHFQSSSRTSSNGD